jgi:hypothetical protein
MKITVKGISVEKAGKKVRFEGAEIEVTTEEVALHFEHLIEMRDAFDHMVNKALAALDAETKMCAEQHKQRMEELEKQNKNDDAYQKRRQETDNNYHKNHVEMENLRHQHWLEKYKEEEEKEVADNDDEWVD